MAVDDEQPLRAAHQLLEACVAGHGRVDRLRSRLYGCRGAFVRLFDLPGKNSSEREKLSKTSREVVDVAQALYAVATGTKDQCVDAVHAALQSVSDTLNLSETHALGLVEQAIRDSVHWSEQTFELHSVAVYLYHEERKSGLRALKRLLQLRCGVVDHAPEDVGAVAREFVEGLLDEPNWVVELLRHAGAWQRQSQTDKQQEEYLRDEADLGVECVLYVAVRDYYNVRESCEPDDTGALVARLGHGEPRCVFGQRDSAELEAIMKLLMDTSVPVLSDARDALPRFAITGVFALFYATVVFCLRVPELAAFTASRWYAKGWRERGLHKVYMYVRCSALAWARAWNDAWADADGDACAELLKEALPADVDAHGRQTCEGVLSFMTNRIVHARDFQEGENRDLFLLCFENTLSPVFELNREAWTSKGAAVADIMAFRDFISLLGTVYKHWPHGAAKVLCERTDIERILMFDFEVPRDVADHGQRHAAKAKAYAGLVHMLGDLCNDAGSAGKVYEMVRYRHDVLAWPHMQHILDHYVRLLTPDPAAHTPPDVGAEIAPSDLQAMQAILRLVRRAVVHSADARAQIMHEWPVIDQLLRLLVSPAPYVLKAAILRTLAAFASDPNVTAFLWAQMEAVNMLQGVRTELAQVEASEELYPETIAFLSLLSVLLRHSNHTALADTLGAPARVPGLAPYFDYVQDVFVHAPARQYRVAHQRWKIQRGCLEVFEQLLQDYTLSARDFLDRYIEVGGVAQAAGRPAALLLMMGLMSAPRQGVHTALMDVVGSGVDTLESLHAQGCARHSVYKLHRHREASVGCGLRLLHTALTMQPSFADAYYATAAQSSLPMLAPLDHTLLAPADRKQCTLVPAIALYTRYTVDAELAYWAVAILLQLSRSPHAQPRLVHVMREAPRAVVLDAFVQRLSAVVPHCDPATKTSLVREERNRYYSAAVVECVLEIMLCHVTVPSEPNLALYLLGYDTPVLHESRLNGSRTPLTVVMDVVLAGLDAPGEELWRSNARVSELCYRLLYELCARPATSAATLDGLRVRHFFSRQLRHMSSGCPHSSLARLLRHQRADAVCDRCGALLESGMSQRLTHDCFRQAVEEALRDEEARACFMGQQTWLVRVVGQEMLLHVQKQPHSRSAQRLARLLLEPAEAAGPVEQGRRKLLELLNMFTSEDDGTDDVARDIQQLRNRYLRALGIDVLADRFQTATDRGCSVVSISALMAELSALPAEEVFADLLLLMVYNATLVLAHMRQQRLLAWRSLAELTFQSLGSPAADQDLQYGATLEIMQDLLHKLHTQRATEHFSHTIVMLATKLREMYATLGQAPTDQLQDVADDVAKAALHRSSSQHMRAHLYGALVHILRANAGGTGLSARYVGPLLEALGRDAIGAGHTCKCTAYALLADLVQRDTKHRMHVLEHKGYLAHMVADVAREDAAVLVALDTNGAPVFVFEARMCFLLAAAKTHDGARVLLLSGVVAQLATCKCLQTGAGERGQRLLLWALRFLACMLSSLGRRNDNMVSQALHFIAANFDVVSRLLTAAASPPELLKLVTSICYHVSSRPELVQQVLGDRSGTLLHVLLGVMGKVIGGDGSRDTQAAAMDATAHGVCADVLGYCRSLMSSAAGDPQPLLGPDLTPFAPSNGPSLALLTTYLSSTVACVANSMGLARASDGALPPALVLVGIECALYLLLLHLQLYLDDASPLPADKRVRLRADAASSLAQILDDVDALSANKQLEASVEFSKRVAGRLRSLLALERRAW